MLKSNEITPEAAKAEPGKNEPIKDAGRVRIGAGSIHFSDPRPAREVTKDAGRVRMGAGSIHF